MKRLLFVLIPVAVALFIWRYNSADPIPVSLYQVIPGDVEEIAANSRAGTVKACQRSQLSLRTGGRIAKLAVDEGERVKAGALLLELENDEQQVLVELAQADLKASQINEERACDLASLAQREADRAQSLSERNLVSTERLDQLKTEALNQNLQCRHAQALTEKAEASVKLAEVQLGQTRLYAPFGGVVASVNAEVGEFATPSTPGIQLPPAIDLIDDGCLYVEAPIDEVEASRLHLGQNARITLDAFRGLSFSGVVGRTDSIISAAEKQARTLSIDVNFAPVPQDANLLVGYSADAEVITGLTQNVLRVPTESIVNGTRVYRYNGTTNKLEAIEITTGLSNWTWTEVTSGLKKDDRILARIEKLNDLMNASVVPAGH